MASSLAPVEFGRGAVVLADQTIPDDFEDLPRFLIDSDVLQRPKQVADKMHLHWSRRERFVVQLGVSPEQLKAISTEALKDEPWEVGESFLFHGQRLQFLVWNNNYDFRTGSPIWWWTRKAIAGGATEGSATDVLLPDGTPAFCDGGPAAPLPLEVAIVHFSSIEAKSLRAFSNSSPKTELAPDQFEAVTHGAGAARIIAPAGSGKTRVLTERLRHVLSDWNLHPQTVCAVAYNTRAAAELTERTAGLPAQIRTLNSIALAIVNGTGGFARSALEAQRREMLSERDVRNILQRIVTVPRRANADPFAGWIEALSAVRLGLRDPSDVSDDWPDLDDFADCFVRYREHLNDHKVLDFDEQIYRAIEILLQDPDARTVAQRRCRKLLVDEFQDLTPAHMLMLRLLASPTLDVFGVGDDDQVIYGYSGAKPAYLVDFDKYFPGAGHHELEVNYRCPPSVVTAANNTLTRNAVRVRKQIRPRPARKSNAADYRVVLGDKVELAQSGLKQIQDWLEEGVAPRSVAVLTRVNVTLLPMQVLLASHAIAHNCPVDGKIMERTGIRTALAYLRIANDPEQISRADITDTVRRPSRRIARNVVEMMTKRPRTSLSSLEQLSASLTGNDAERVEQYVHDLRIVSTAIKKGTEKALTVIRDRVGLGETMEALDGSRSAVDRSAHGDDLAALIAVAHLHPEVSTFESWLRQMLIDTPSEDGVELSTVHRVKGREWDRVLVFDASDDLMPHRLSEDTAEERRVFHVAITRCREQVVIIGDKTKPSRFLKEAEAPGTPTAERKTKQNAPEKYPVASADDALVTALKQWRAATARTLGVPAFTILHDAHLEGIARVAPKTLGELSRCKGIGGTKLDRWGDEILAAIDNVR